MMVRMKSSMVKAITTLFSIPMKEVIRFLYLFARVHMEPRFYVSTSKSIIKALINMHSFEIQLSPIG
ncbi:hypothetical protein A7J65_19555 [Escherichia coli]|nr:hypothetical protein A7J65_19555 [Escherichia coli]